MDSLGFVFFFTHPYPLPSPRQLNYFPKIRLPQSSLQYQTTVTSTVTFPSFSSSTNIATTFLSFPPPTPRQHRHTMRFCCLFPPPPKPPTHLYCFPTPPPLLKPHLYCFPPSPPPPPLPTPPHFCSFRPPPISKKHIKIHCTWAVLPLPSVFRVFYQEFLYSL